MSCSAAKAFTSRRKRLPIFSSSAGEGIGKPRCCGEEGHHLPAHLQIGDVGVQVEPVDAVQLEADMTLEHVIDVRHARHAHQ